jgi:hypothetical protein
MTTATVVLVVAADWLRQEIASKAVAASRRMARFIFMVGLNPV